MDLNQLKSQLKRFGIKPRHSLGQNFLLNEQVLDTMIEAAKLSRDDTVLEVGPGLGILTRKLSERAGLVLAVEKDRKLVKASRKLFKSKKNVKIIQADALFINPAQLINRRTEEPKNKEFLGSYVPKFLGYKIVANIPYYLTGKLLQNFLETKHKPSLMVLLLQKEVALRITARPGGHSVLSITTQFYAEPEIITEVPKEDFYPQPEVDSAVIRLKIRGNPLFPVNDRKFFQLVKIGFSSKRKQLHNNLKVITKEPQNVKTKEPWKALLSSLNINPRARAEDLSLEDWYNLYQKIFDTS